MKTHTVYTYKLPFQNRNRTTVDATPGEYAQVEHGLPVGLVNAFNVHGANTNREAIAAVIDLLSGGDPSVVIEEVIPTK